MSGVYYPQAALEGFGMAVAKQLGITVKFDVGQASTDGHTISLPPALGPMSRNQFMSACGTVLHEAAHVYYNSVEHFKRYAAQGELFKLAYNVVLDVADETRLEYRIPTAKDLFLTGNMVSFDEIVTDKRFFTNDAAWAVCVMAMTDIRVCAGRKRKVWGEVNNYMRNNSTELDKRVAASGQSFESLYRQVKDVLLGAYTKTSSGRQPSRNRTSREWSKLSGIADDIAEILKDLPPPSSSSSGGQGSMAGNGSSSGYATKVAPVAPGAEIAQAGEGENVLVAGPAAKPLPTQPMTGVPATGAGRGPRSGSYNAGKMNRGLYSTLIPSMRGVAARLVESQDANGIEGGYLAGPRLSPQLDRVFTDGRIFARRNGEGENLNAELWLDRSVSMRATFSDACAVAQATADALAGSASYVGLGVFGATASPIKDFKAVPGLESSTNTERGVRIAHKNLTDKRGRRVLILVTDGNPGCESECAKSINEARRDNIAVIIISYNTNALNPRAFPGCEMIRANGPAELAAGCSRAVTKITR